MLGNKSSYLASAAAPTRHKHTLFGPLLAFIVNRRQPRPMLMSGRCHHVLVWHRQAKTYGTQIRQLGSILASLYQ